MPNFLFDKSKPIRLELDRQAVAVAEEQAIREQGSTDQNGTQAQQSKRIKDGLLYVPEFNAEPLSGRQFKVRVFDTCLFKAGGSLNFTTQGDFEYPLGDNTNLLLKKADYIKFINNLFATPIADWKDTYKITDANYYLDLFTTKLNTTIDYPGRLKDTATAYELAHPELYKFQWKDGIWKFKQTQIKKGAVFFDYGGSLINYKLTDSIDIDAPDLTSTFRVNKNTDIFLIPRVAFPKTNYYVAGTAETFNLVPYPNLTYIERGRALLINPQAPGGNYFVNQIYRIYVQGNKVFYEWKLRQRVLQIP